MFTSSPKIEMGRCYHLQRGGLHPKAVIVIKAVPESSTSGESFADPVEFGWIP